MSIKVYKAQWTLLKMFNQLIFLTLICSAVAHQLATDIPMSPNSTFSLVDVNGSSYSFNCYDVAHSITGYYRKQVLQESTALCENKYSCQYNSSLNKIICEPEVISNKVFYDIEMWCEKILINAPVSVGEFPVCTVGLSSDINLYDKIVKDSCFVIVNITDNRSLTDKFKEISSGSLLLLGLFLSVLSYSIIKTMYEP